MPPSENAVSESLAEFLALADRLQMPDSERQGILGIAPASWPAIAAGEAGGAEIGTEEFRRRLRYILPLLRRALANRTGLAPPPGNAPPSATAGA